MGDITISQHNTEFGTQHVLNKYQPLFSRATESRVKLSAPCESQIPHPGTATSFKGGNLEASDGSPSTMLNGSRVMEEPLLSLQVLKGEAEDGRR